MKIFKVSTSLLLSAFLQVVVSNELRGGVNQRRSERVEEGVATNVYKGDLGLDTPDGLDLDISKTPPLFPSPCLKRCPNRGDVAYKVNGVCTCLSPCEEVCGNIRMRCDGQFAEAAWAKAEKRKCFELEYQQGGSVLTRMFLRTTCKCPERDYEISEACEPHTQANLKNCILAEITANHEINFGTLENVQLRHVQSIGSEYDIDFQGEVHNSHFCHLEAGEDIEFGGEECPIQFHNNYVKLMTIGEDLQFEKGTWVGPDNIFGSVNIVGDFRFDNSNDAIRDTEVWENHFASIDAGGYCEYHDGIPESDILVVDNTCDTFDVFYDSDCDPTVFGGFTCV